MTMGVGIAGVLALMIVLMVTGGVAMTSRPQMIGTMTGEGEYLVGQSLLNKGHPLNRGHFSRS